MNQNIDRLQQLFRRYLDNSLSQEEYADFWMLLNTVDDESQLDPELRQLWHDAAGQQPVIEATAWDAKMNNLKGIIDGAGEIKTTKRRAPFVSLKRWVAAAAVLTGIVTLIYFIAGDKPENPVVLHKKEEARKLADVQPGGNRAELILGDGSKIILDSAGNGVLATQSGIQIIKRRDGQLEYSGSLASAQEEIFNTLSTPRGGQYQITLPDGSIVWLNAASSLKYPAAFLQKQRKVQITGEAYFEVAKNPDRPFVVQVNDMEVQVLGTSFNINSYEDELVKKTTLLEGFVKITSRNAVEYLKPGQQAQVKSPGEASVVNDADTEASV